MSKECSSCKIIKPIDNFYFHRKRNSPQAYCKPCHNKKQREARPKRLNKITKLGYKMCTGGCKKEKELAEFYNEYNYCKKCINDRNNRYRKSDKRRERNQYLINTYNITLEDYENKLKEQNFTCEICNKPETCKSNRGGAKNLAVDHNHNNGKIRGLLCTSCNTKLSAIENDLEKYLGYLKKYE